MQTLSRAEVYAAIDRERDHQDDKWGVNQPQSFMGLIAVIEAELDEVKKGWLKDLPGKSAPLNELVQVAATAVAALEKYGVEGCPTSTNDTPPLWVHEYTPSDVPGAPDIITWRKVNRKDQETDDDQRHEAERTAGTSGHREDSQSGDVGVSGPHWGFCVRSGDSFESPVLRQDQDS